MQPRLNKKTRKGRNNPNNRERTVTTLTEDPNSSYLIPKSSEELPNNIIPNFNHPQQPQLANPNTVMNQFQLQASSGNFTYGYNGAFGMPQAPSMHTQPAQPFYTNQGVRVPGNNDLEILQNLKQMILDGQHPLYRPIPQPAALAKLYLGPSDQATSAPLPQHYSEQQQQQEQEQDSTAATPHDAGQMQVSNSTGSSLPSAALSGPPSPADISRRPPRMQNKESWDPSRKSFQTQHQQQSQAQQAPASSANVNNNPGQQEPAQRTLSNINTSNLGPDRGSSIPPSTIVKVESGDHQLPRVQESPSGRGRYDGPPSARSPRPIDHREPHSYNRPPPNDVSPIKAYYDGKEDTATIEARRRMPPPDDRRYSHPYDDRDRDRDRALPPRMNAAATTAAADMSINVDRALPPPSDDRYDRDRDRDRYRYNRDWPERDREREREREREYRAPASYERYSRPPYQTDPRRPLEYERKRYEPELADNNNSTTARRMSDARAAPPSAETPGLPPPVDSERDRDRGTGAPSLVAASGPPRDTRPPPVDTRPVDPRGPPPSVSAPPPSTTSDARVPSGAASASHTGSADGGGRQTPAGRPPGSVSIASTTSEQNRDQRPGDDRNSRPIPLEERLGRTTLQERLSGGSNGSVPQATGRLEPERARLEDRLAPSGASAAVPRTVGPAAGDRQQQPDTSAAVQDRHDAAARAERYTRPITPLPNEAAVPPMHRSSYPAPPPRSASVVRDDRSKAPSPPTARPPPPSAAREFRESGRERHDRASYTRPYDRPDAMDVDVPRYPDGYRRPYSPPPPPPPSAGERRAPSTYPASPRTAAEPPYDERRYPSGSREWYPPYDRRSRDWTQAEEDAYWKLRVYPPPAPAERERYERDAAQPSTRAWEPRAERDPREYPPPPPPPRAPSPPRVYERQPSSYPPPVPPPDERYPIASREIDRTRSTAPPAYAGRVRAHSPSPIRRTAMDDPRPPLKRPREDYPPAEYSYPPSRDVRREYPRPGSPVGYYERPPPPPPGAGAEREYPAARERAAYPPPPPPAQSASYERPRSPGRAPASYSRAAYSRPPDLREREYMPPSTRPA